MDLWKTEKLDLTTEDIEYWIQKHEAEKLPTLNKLWRYYLGDNPGIVDRENPSPDNPNNNTPVAYGRKIITTFTGYAFRPKYISYKPIDNSAEAKAYADQINDTFSKNQEHIISSRDGRNMGIFGKAYELHYVDGNDVKTPRFAIVDPRECILLYDYSINPKILFGIRYYLVSMVGQTKRYKVELYSSGPTKIYTREAIGSGRGRYSVEPEKENFYQDVALSPFYFGDECLGLIKPVQGLIDDYDILVSDSIVEFDRFANAYLRLVKMSALPPSDPRQGNAIQQWLRRVKRSRVFENLNNKDDVSFLTKDIPTEFMNFMTELVDKQIRIQSHVPDFATMATGDLSGAAMDRLLFDFENVCSSVEADFDSAIYRRLELMNKINAQNGGIVADSSVIVITHKRNKPSNVKEWADTAVSMKNAGFSRRSIADMMPDDIISDTDSELAEQDADLEKRMPDIDQFTPKEDTEEEKKDENA